MKKIAYLAIAAMFLGCQGKTKTESEDFTSKLAQEGTEAIEGVELKTTTLSFNTMEHDFGNVVVGQDYTFKFVVKNTGSSPLIIEDAKASCGCTVPKKPEQPIKPGQSDVIEVTFSPKPGQGVTSKSVTVTANTVPKITTLTIRANVNDGTSQTNVKGKEQVTRTETNAAVPVLSTSPAQ